ncbi:MAG: phosphatidylserine decarboxylase [Chlamydiia bacterium]|nr:phosphatidylserine decarboxylase [Chlamydiia bacterium]
MKIYYIDRKSGAKEEEKIYGGALLKFLYGERFFGWLLMHAFSRIPLFSYLAGYFQNRPASAKKVAPFIAEYGIDTSEFVKSDFHSFNDFFTRKLQPACRPIVQDPHRLAMPADGRYLVFPKISELEKFYVKGQAFDLKQFLQDPILAHRYAEGSLLLVRLCPTDYHRFHFPCVGIPSRPRLIPGSLFSVNPIALQKRVAILFENKRMVTEFQTERFGQILYIEIGATCVGTIHQNYTPEKRVEKGEEKGCFSFGGSCIALLFESGRIRFDEDLIRNSQQKLETKAHFGDSFAVDKTI